MPEERGGVSLTLSPRFAAGRGNFHTGIQMRPFCLIWRKRHLVVHKNHLNVQNVAGAAKTR